MKHIDTPAGKFQVFLNGMPVDFEAEPHCPYTYCDNSGSPIPILACYLISANIQKLKISDVIEAKYEYGAFKCDGGGEGMDNAVGTVGGYVIGIGTTDTQYLEWDINQRQLPYENVGLCNTGFLFRIVDDPAKYTVRSVQQQITFIIAWESSIHGYARDIVSFMTS